MAITPEDVADAVRQWCTAWHTRDIPTILAMEAQAGGFGFRRVDRRDHVAMGDRKTLEQFFGRMEAYQLEPEDIQTAVTGAVGLAWNPSRGRPVALYSVYRASEGGAFERIGTTAPERTTYTDRDVQRGVTYRYAVTATDDARQPNESPRSNEVTVTVPQ